ncbi:Fc.00g051140.m01.CDS01 [Cosmosporella sp. VM-42]
MLVTRQLDTEHSHWPFSKYDPSPRKPPSPRMSERYDSALSTQSDWPGQYPYSSHGESGSFPLPFGPDNNGIEASQSRSMAQSGANALGILVKEEPGSPADREHLPQSTQSSPVSKATGSARSRSPIPLPLDEPIPASSFGQGNKSPSPKEEDEVDFDEDEALDVDGDISSQTAAERTAARRKMKRFRLTHQQTRFLMSEFAKQPHPDAAHRERLSREIPGLSPRQVQVWFQNRRAKIKRLNADDRDRMIKMRAVPDDFDNVQALHSPYGAVHGLGTPIPSPMEFGNQSYAEHMMRPLMVDVRRSNGSEHMSPSGLTPGFGNVGFGPAGGMNNNMMSPLSPAPSDRYTYGSSVPTPPLSGGMRTSNPFGRQNGMDASMRSLQPLHLRDPVSQSRPENLQSPLRTSMSWKGDAIGYSTYAGANTSPNMSERHQPVYQSGQMGAYDSTTFSGNPNQSPTANYSSMQSPESRSRLRAASASLPLNLDLSTQYRPASTEGQTPSPSRAPRATASTAQYGNSSIYTTSYPSAPLTAPVDFSPHKSSTPRVPEYPGSQMSAPIAPPSDFAHAFQTNQTSRTPMVDSFVSGFNQGQQNRSPNMHKRKRSLTLPTGSSVSFSRPGAPFPGHTT